MSEQEDKMKIWNQCCRPPAEVLKPITFGPLKNKTDINPQWRLKKMTEMFGPIGEGWGYIIKNQWSENIGDDIMCFVAIEMYTKDGGMPISGLGGSTLASVAKRGTPQQYLSTTDEGYKMALTDALSVAMKQLGIAADIYAGLWDGSKYRDAPKAPPTPKVLTVEDVQSAEFQTRLSKQPDFMTAINAVSKVYAAPLTDKVNQEISKHFNARKEA